VGGVYKNHNGWCVRPYVNGKRVYGGTYPTEEQAMKALGEITEGGRQYYKVGEHVIPKREVHPSISVNALRKRILVEKWDLHRAKTEPIGTSRQRKKPHKRYEALVDGKIVDLRGYDMHPKVTYKLAKQRMKHNNFTLEEALMTPPDRDWRVKEEWKAGDITVPAEMVKLAKKNGITYDQVMNRLKSKSIKNPWTIEKAVTEPVRKKNCHIEENFRTPKAEEIKKWKKVAIQNGIPLDTYMERIYQKKMEPRKAAGL
jgi:hypothetical protein